MGGCLRGFTDLWALQQNISLATASEKSFIALPVSWWPIAVLWLLLYWLGSHCPHIRLGKHRRRRTDAMETTRLTQDLHHKKALVGRSNLIRISPHNCSHGRRNHFKKDLVGDRETQVPGSSC